MKKITGDGSDATRTIIRPTEGPLDALADKAFGESARTLVYPYKNERIKGDETDKVIESGNYYYYKKSNVDATAAKLESDPRVKDYKMVPAAQWGDPATGKLGKMNRELFDLSRRPLFTVIMNGETYYATDKLISG